MLHQNLAPGEASLHMRKLIRSLLPAQLYESGLHPIAHVSAIGCLKFGRLLRN